MNSNAVMFMQKKNADDAYDIGCELQKKRIECAIMIKAAEAEMEVEG